MELPHCIVPGGSSPTVTIKRHNVRASPSEAWTQVCNTLLTATRLGREETSRAWWSDDKGMMRNCRIVLLYGGKRHVLVTFQSCVIMTELGFTHFRLFSLHFSVYHCHRSLYFYCIYRILLVFYLSFPYDIQSSHTTFHWHILRLTLLMSLLGVMYFQLLG